MKTFKSSRSQQSLMLTEEEKQAAYWEKFDIGVEVYKPLFASFLSSMTTLNQKLQQFNLPVQGMVPKFASGRLYVRRVPLQKGDHTHNEEQVETFRPLYNDLNQQLTTILEASFFPLFKKIDQALQRELSWDDALILIKAAHHAYEEIFPRQAELLLPHHQLHKDLENLYQQCTGDDDKTVIYDLLTGVWNKSLEMDQELWKLAEKVKASKQLRTVFEQNSPEELEEMLATTPEGDGFMIDFRRVLEKYGYKTANSRVLTDETWIENPSILFATIGSYVKNDYNFNERYQRNVETRKEKYKAILQRIPEGILKDRFIQYYQWALAASNIDDDHHFYMDEMFTAKIRLLLLHVGDFLVANHVLMERNDIFYLYMDELQDVLKHPQSLLELIIKRQEEHRENEQKNMPATFGTPPKYVASDIISERASEMTETNEVSTETQTLKGSAGSKGKHTGMVKVIHGQEDFAKLEEGDVLVAKTTTPPWTVLFSRAGAIITNVGGILSHPGITAREYHVPAVLGTKNGTTVLKDGDRVTVDGTAGVITIHD